jgi:hypothetical protein
VEPGVAEEAQHFAEHLRGVAVPPLAVGPPEELERAADVPPRLRAQHGADLRRREHAEEVAELGLQLRAPRLPELEQPAGVAHEPAPRLLREVIVHPVNLPPDGRGFRGEFAGGGAAAEAAGLQEEMEMEMAMQQGRWVLGEVPPRHRARELSAAMRVTGNGRRMPENVPAAAAVAAAGGFLMKAVVGSGRQVRGVQCILTPHGLFSIRSSS